MASTKYDTYSSTANSATKNQSYMRPLRSGDSGLMYEPSTCLACHRYAPPPVPM
jgi:hypothetical protein